MTACSGKKNDILALDTAGGNIAACIISDGRYHTLSSVEHNSGITRSTAIIPALLGLLEQTGLSWDQLDALALGAGPGSFTGLRIAAATLAGINAGLHLPIVQLSSLAITARQADTPEAIRVLEDARAGEVFYGCYQNGKAMGVDACLPWDHIKSLQPGRYCCHNEPPEAMLPYLSHWERLPLAHSRSQALALEVQASCQNLAPSDQLPLYPAPAYLQLSQAERNAHV